MTLPEGLTTIGSYAFRNKVVAEVMLPTTVKKLNKNTFEKTQSDVITKVYVTSKEQYEDTKNFPVGTGHKLYLKMIQYGLLMILLMEKRASVCGRQMPINQQRTLLFM